MGKEPTYPLVPAFSQGEAKKWDTVEQSGEIIYTGKRVLSFYISVKMYWVAELKNKYSLYPLDLENSCYFWRNQRQTYQKT